MSETFDSVEKRLLSTREKIRKIRRDITGGVVEDKIKELGKKSYAELDNELDGLHISVVEAKSKAKDVSAKIFEELEQDISAAVWAILKPCRWQSTKAVRSCRES